MPPPAPKQAKKKRPFCWKTALELQLPYPPSANRLWRRQRGRMMLSGAALAYRQTVAGLWWTERQQQNLQPIGPRKCRIKILAHPPDRRPRDLDNLLKPLLDALQWAGIMENDSQVQGLSIRWANIRPGGQGRVRLLVRQ